jgi:hypothetical protein
MRLGYGIYAKTEPSTLTGNPRSLEGPRNFD